MIARPEALASMFGMVANNLAGDVVYIKPGEGPSTKDPLSGERFHAPSPEFMELLIWNVIAIITGFVLGVRSASQVGPRLLSREELEPVLTQLAGAIGTRSSSPDDTSLDASDRDNRLSALVVRLESLLREHGWPRKLARVRACAIIQETGTNMPPPRPEVARRDLRRLFPQVFVSYARADFAAVEELSNDLHDRGFRIWIDVECILPGQAWEKAIQNALKSSAAAIVCLSRRSVDRRGMFQAEISMALDLMKRLLEEDIFLIPLRLEECDVPDRLDHLQYVDLFRENGLDRLTLALRSLHS